MQGSRNSRDDALKYLHLHSDRQVLLSLTLISSDYVAFAALAQAYNRGNTANEVQRKRTSHSTLTLYCIYHFLSAQRFHPSLLTT